MHSFFFKVFLWFWLTVVLVGAALAVSIHYSFNSFDEFRSKPKALISTLLPAESKNAAELLEKSGALALDQYLDLFERRHDVRAFLVPEHGNQISNRKPPPKALEVASLAIAEDGLQSRGDAAGQRARGPSGRNYALVLLWQGTPARMTFLVVQLPLIILIASGLSCYLIARHFATPLVRLREAAAAIAEGHLDARVGPALIHRRDEIAQLARDFDCMAERIEALVAGQRRLLGDASHELRSPLARLMIGLSMASKRPAEESSEHLQRIALETRRLDKLIGQLLTLSRIDSRVDAGRGARVDLANLVLEVASDGDFEARAVSRHVVAASAAPCAVLGSEEDLRSAVENVVRNAIRHTREGTTVEISLDRQDRSGGANAVLRVRDHGAGVPEEMLAEIFLPFRRVGEDSDGAGLGLAITERAVSTHGGTVRAANAVEGGLVVEITLPLG